MQSLGTGVCSCGAECPPGVLIPLWFDRHVLAMRAASPVPLGLRPRWLAAEQRLTEVQAAVKRYLDAGVDVPHEWLIEQGALARWLSEHEESS